MKKIITFCLLLLFAFIIVGCDSGPSDQPKPTPTPHTIHMDDDGNGICDICGESIIHE